MNPRAWLYALLFPLLLLGCQAPGTALRHTVFLVRHAERADDGAMTGQQDPHLSEAGYARAEVLAGMLKDVAVQHIHSSDRLRAKETAAPAAAAEGVEVQLYDLQDPGAFAEKLLGTPGRHLVVGHSNTLPALVAALGGDPHGEIETTEYDRLYILFIREGGTETLLLRFGAPSGG